MLELKILNKENKMIFYEKGEKIDSMYEAEYQKGDKIVIHKKDSEYLMLQLDQDLAESIVYAPSSAFEFEIPFGELKRGYSDKAFSGDKHIIMVSEVSDEEAFGYRNIALNSHDKRGQKNYFPHAYANLVTREDVCFYERNAIDGICENQGHGDYPEYVSGLL